VDLEAYGEITSVVVSRSGDVVVEEYLEGDADTLRNTRSCTKTVLGMLLGIAICSGYMSSSLPGDVSSQSLQSRHELQRHDAPTIGAWRRPIATCGS
jgi:hypothetical protein